MNAINEVLEVGTANGRRLSFCVAGPNGKLVTMDRGHGIGGPEGPGRVSGQNQRKRWVLDGER